MRSAAINTGTVASNVKPDPGFDDVPIWMMIHNYGVCPVVGTPSNGAEEVSIPAFVTAMYEQAEINKKAKEEQSQCNLVRQSPTGRILPHVFRDGKWVEAPDTFDHEKRIKALESALTIQLGQNEKFAEAWLISKALEGRLASFEKAKNEMDEAIVGLMAKERKYEYLTGPIQPAKDHWPLIGYRKEDSPKNISFSIALEYAKAGRKIKRRGWAAHYAIGIEGDELVTLMNRNPSFQTVNMGDIVAEDWEVLPDLP